MAQRMALYMQDKHDIQYELEIAKYAEERGFSEIWQADTRLARDCVVMMSADTPFSFYSWGWDFQGVWTK